MSRIRLPEDDGLREDTLNQWWYWTGHFNGSKGGQYGFEFVFFATELPGGLWSQMAQNAITDIKRDYFKGQEFVWVGKPKVVQDGYDLATENGEMTVIGGGGTDTIHSDVAGYTLDIKLKELRPAVLHYGGKRHNYDFGGYTYYYSRELMEGVGTLTRPDGITEDVTGHFWFDRQWGSMMQAVLLGWQWFSIQLDDNTQIMMVFANQTATENYASIAYPNGHVRVLRRTEFQMEVLEWWRSPTTGIQYPSGWKIHLPDMELVVEPYMKDQEMAARYLWYGPKYWEGSCSVRGTKSGTSSLRGKCYVELNGFDKNSGPQEDDKFKLLDGFAHTAGVPGKPFYVNRPNNQSLAQPFSFDNTRLYGFPFKADVEALQKVVDKYLNTPTGGDTRYIACFPSAFIYFADMGKTRGLGEPSKDRGWLPEKEVGIWFPVIATKQVARLELLERFLIFPFYMFLDSGHALVSGREIYGFPKEIADVNLPESVEKATKFSMDATVFKTFSPQTEGKLETLITLKSNSGKPGKIAEPWNDLDTALKSGYRLMFGEEDSITLPGLGLFFQTLNAILNEENAMVFLKQFRDIENADTACYQAICEAPAKVTKFRGGGLLEGTYSLDIEQVASHPIIQEMGLEIQELKALRGFYVDFDFEFLNGRVIWQAGGDEK